MNLFNDTIMKVVLFGKGKKSLYIAMISLFCSVCYGQDTFKSFHVSSGPACILFDIGGDTSLGGSIGFDCFIGNKEKASVCLTGNSSIYTVNNLDLNSSYAVFKDSIQVDKVDITGTAANTAAVESSVLQNVSYKGFEPIKDGLINIIDIKAMIGNRLIRNEFRSLGMLDIFFGIGLASSFFSIQTKNADFASLGLKTLLVYAENMNISPVFYVRAFNEGGGLSTSISCGFQLFSLFNNITYNLLAQKDSNSRNRDFATMYCKINNRSAVNVEASIAAIADGLFLGIKMYAGISLQRERLINTKTMLRSFIGTIGVSASYPSISETTNDKSEVDGAFGDFNSEYGKELKNSIFRHSNVGLCLIFGFSDI